MLKGRSLLVTGASGYLGSWLAEYARREGAKVRILLRRMPAHLEAWASQFEVVTGDISDPASLKDVCRGCEIVWHAASANETVCNQGLDRAVRINVEGSVNMMEAAARQNVSRFVKLSTFHVYGRSSGDITEDTTPSPVSAYGVSNLMGDVGALFFKKARGLKVVIPRISNGYGPPLFREVDRWTLVINDLCRMVVEKREIVLKGSGLAQRDFISICDIYKAVALLTAAPGDEAVYNVGSGRSRSILEVARLIKVRYDRKHGADIPFRSSPPQPGEASVEVRYDVSKIRSLGFHSEDMMENEIDGVLNLLEGGSVR